MWIIDKLEVLEPELGPTFGFLSRNIGIQIFGHKQ